jgi:uncharacterized membrane protein
MRLQQFFSALLLSAFFFIGVALVVPTSSLAFEVIKTFDSHITVNRDTSLTIQETIQYTTDLTKHGIYRYIPVRYAQGGLNVSANVRNIKVTDSEDEAIPFERSFQNGNVMLKIGDPDTTFTGDKTYVITYDVENAVREVPNTVAPELYWDITGEGWQIMIASSSAMVVSPYAEILKVACYAGEFGQNDGKCQTRQTDDYHALFSYNVPISYGDNMTVALQFEAGSLVFPTFWEKVWKVFRDNMGLVVLVLPALILVRRWWRTGRDAMFLSLNVFNQDEGQPSKIVPLFFSRHIPLVYEPFKDLTPGEAGAILDEKVDNQDIIAEIIDLARQKYLKIERLEAKKLFGKKVEYQFTKLKEPSEKLPPQQKYLMDHLFATKDVVKLSDLKGTFSTHMEEVKKLIFKSLTDKGLFKENPQNAQGKSLALAIILSIVAGAWLIHLLNQGAWWGVPLYILSTLIALVCAYWAPAKTAKGTNFAWQAKGLQRNIKYGEWREKIKEKHLFFEEVLPFAIAFGVVDQLSKDMKTLNVKAPQYLAGSNLSTFSTNAFVSSFTTQASSNLTYNPSSSSYSSGSGFSGGSSGGGGGGGGGGSW